MPGHSAHPSRWAGHPAFGRWKEAVPTVNRRLLDERIRFTESGSDRAGAGPDLLPHRPGAVPQLFHAECVRPVYRRLLYPGRGSGGHGGPGRAPLSFHSCGHAGRCCLRVRDRHFADPHGGGQSSLRHHREHGAVFREYRHYEGCFPGKSEQIGHGFQPAESGAEGHAPGRCL